MESDKEAGMSLHLIPAKPRATSEVLVMAKSKDSRADARRSAG